MKPTKKQIVDALTKGAAKVTFKKSDGSTRVMNATLKRDDISKDDAAKLTEGSTLTVYDNDKNAWRSFNVDSVSNLEVL